MRRQETGLHSYIYNNMKHTYPARVKPLMKDLQAYLEEQELVGDAFFCSPTVWKARGEEYGTTSDLVLVYDGSYLYDILNTYGGGIFYESIWNICQKHDYFFEPCTSWYCAFYKN